MAGADYGVVIKKNGKIVPTEGDMQLAVGFTLDTVLSTDNKVQDFNGEYTAYLGDRDLLVGIYKEHVTIVSEDKILADLYYGVEDYEDTFTYTTKYSRHLLIKGIGFHIKRIGEANRFKLNFSYKSNRYEVLFGYGVDVCKDMWYYDSEKERRNTYKWFARGSKGYEHITIEDGCVVGCGTIIRNSNGEILLGERSDHWGWCLAGGKVEPGESAEVAAIRELKEEFGVVATKIHLVGKTKSQAFIRSLNKMCNVLSYVYEADEYILPEALIPNEEILDFSWVKLADIKVVGPRGTYAYVPGVGEKPEMSLFKPSLMSILLLNKYENFLIHLDK